jgi:hypothetical protein
MDGTYTKFETKETPPVPCTRCPDYAPESGIWKLNLSKGVFRIFHKATGWKDIGSFIVSEDQLILANDPVCHVKAQVLKDAVMATSVEPFLDRRILFCCGHFHSDYSLGIPYQPQKNHPDLKITVITFSSSIGTACEGSLTGGQLHLVRKLTFYLLSRK